MTKNFVLVLLTMAQISIAYESCNLKTLDIVFVIDSSTSIRDSNSPDSQDDNWAVIISFVLQVVTYLTSDKMDALRIGLVPYSTNVPLTRVLPLTSDFKLVLNSIKNLQYLSGNTNTSGALRQAGAMLRGSRPDGRQKIIVLITDGQSNVDTQYTLSSARLNKNDNIIQCAVGVTMYADQYELQDIVTDPSSYYYMSAENFSHLNSLINRLLQILTCSQPPLPEPCKDTRADLAFLLDASGSIVEPQPGYYDYTNWNLMKEFIIDVIKNLNIGKNQTRISVILFSKMADVVFYLDEFSDTASIVNKIKSMENLRSQTNTSGALKVLNQQVFTMERGDRKEVNNIAIIITDGQSNVDAEQTIPQANIAKTNNVRIFSIGLTNEIYEKELKAMCSIPLEQHYFNRTSISLVGTVVSQLVWSVCHDPCASPTPDTCTPNTLRCDIKQKLSWTKFGGSLIIGHDYSRLTNIADPVTCQTVCLQDALCRSVEYIRVYSECSVSFYRRADVMSYFTLDAEVDYYEWTCVDT